MLSHRYQEGSLHLSDPFQHHYAHNPSPLLAGLQEKHPLQEPDAVQLPDVCFTGTSRIRVAQVGARTPTGLVKTSIMERGILFLVALWEGKWMRSEEQVWAASHESLIYAWLLRTTPPAYSVTVSDSNHSLLKIYIYKTGIILQPQKGSQIASMFHSPIRDKHFIKNKEYSYLSSHL